MSQFPANPGVLPGGGFKYTPGTTFADPPPPRAWVNGVYGSVTSARVPVVVAEDSIALAGRGGSLLTKAAWGVTLADAAGAVGRCVALANPYCMAGAAAFALYDYAKARHPSQVPGSLASPGQLDVDPTVPQETYSGDCWMDRYGQCQGSPTDAAHSYDSLWPGIPFEAVSYNGQTYVWRYSDGWSSSTNYSVSKTQSASAKRCPASVDPLDPQYSIPAGSAPFSDGTCPTARYQHQSRTPEQFASDVAGKVDGWGGPAGRGSMGQALQEAVQQGGQTVPATITVSGPAQQTGTPTVTTTTNADGTTTTKTETPTYTYNYAGDTITYNTSVVTTTNTTNANGSPVSSTTTTTTGPKSDPTDPCAGHGERLGCQTAGDPSGQPTLYTKKTRTFSDALSSFSTTVKASPIGTALGGFWTVSLSAGTCPTWHLELEYIGASAEIDFLCWSMTTAALAVFATVINIVAGWTAYRVAVE